VSSSTTTAAQTTTTASSDESPGGAKRIFDLSDAAITATAMVGDGSKLWLAGAGAGSEAGRVACVELEKGTVSWAVDVPDSAVGLALGVNGTLFVVGGGDGADPTGGITRLDSQTGRLLGTQEIADGSPYGVAADGAAVWVTDARTDRVWRVDPNSGRITATTHVAKNPTGVAMVGGTVWVASPIAGVVTRLDATTGADRGTIPVDGANSVVANPSAVWVGGPSFVRLDPATGKRLGEIKAAGPATVQALSNGWVWGVGARNSLFRGLTEDLLEDPTPVGPGRYAAAVAAGDRLWGYDGLRIVEWALPLLSNLEFPAERPHDGQNFGYVRGIDGDQLVFDPAETLTDPHATDVAITDGYGITKEEGLPGGFYDRNRDGKTYRLLLAAHAKFFVLKADQEIKPAELDRDAFARALIAGPGEYYGSPGQAPYKVTIEAGKVARVEQVYRP
jgi:hypothetical protein